MGVCYVKARKRIVTLIKGINSSLSMHKEGTTRPNVGWQKGEFFETDALLQEDEELPAGILSEEEIKKLIRASEKQEERMIGRYGSLDSTPKDSVLKMEREEDDRRLKEQIEDLNKSMTEMQNVTELEIEEQELGFIQPHKQNADNETIINELDSFINDDDSNRSPAFNVF